MLPNWTNNIRPRDLQMTRGEVDETTSRLKDGGSICARRLLGNTLDFLLVPNATLLQSGFTINSGHYTQTPEWSTWIRPPICCWWLKADEQLRNYRTKTGVVFEQPESKPDHRFIKRLTKKEWALANSALAFVARHGGNECWFAKGRSGIGKGAMCEHK